MHFSKSWTKPWGDVLDPDNMWMFSRQLDFCLIQTFLTNNALTQNSNQFADFSENEKQLSSQ